MADLTLCVIAGLFFANASYKGYPLVFDALALLVVLDALFLVFARDAIHKAIWRRDQALAARRRLFDSAVTTMCLTVLGTLSAVFYAIWPRGEHLSAGLAGAALVGAILSLAVLLVRESEIDSPETPTANSGPNTCQKNRGKGTKGVRLMRESIQTVTAIILACILVLGLLIYRKVDQASSAVVDTTDTAVAAIDALTHDGVVGLGIDPFDHNSMDTQWGEWESEVPLDDEARAAAEEAARGAEDPPNEALGFGFPTGGWTPPELRDELEYLCDQVAWMLDNPNQSAEAFATPERSATFALIAEVCDLYLRDVVTGVAS